MTEKEGTYGKKYYARHREERLAYGRNYRVEHREKERARNKKYRVKHREEIKAADQIRRLRYKYGITQADYDRLRREQNDCCKICGKRMKLDVDHDHDTRKVRGLLCHHCNVAIGMAGESVDILRKMITYLQAAKKQ
jgi:hypothetical protein